MGEELKEVVHAIRDMEAAITRLDSRISRIEEAVFEGARPVTAATREAVRDHGHGGSAQGIAAEPSRSMINSVLIGRSLIVFGGAYLLRALTESGAFPIMIGAMAGLLYAAIFLWLAFRQAPIHRASATFHGMMSVLIAMPLAVETAVSFQKMRSEVSLLIIAAYCGVAGTIAIRNNLKALGWIVQVVTVGSLIALTVGSRSFVLGLYAFLLLAVGSLLEARRISTPALIFLPAAFSTLLVVPIADLSVTPETSPGAISGLVAILAFVLVWIGGILVDSWYGEDRPGPGMLIHLFFVLVVGVGAGLYVSLQSSLSFLFAPVVTIVALATGIFAWWMTTHKGDDDKRSLIFVIVTTLLLMAVTGSLLSPAATSVVWLILAALSILPARSGHPLLYASATILVVGAAFESGLLTWTLETLLSVPDPSELVPSFSAVLTMAVALVVLFTTPPIRVKKKFFRSIADGTTTTIIAGGFAGFAIHAVQLALPVIGASTDDAGAVAAVRTIVLSLATILLAWLARFTKTSTTGVLVNPVLILTAILIVTVNVRIGRAATHFPAFIMYGLSLIVAPALKRRSVSIRQERKAAAPELPESDVSSQEPVNATEAASRH